MNDLLKQKIHSAFDEKYVGNYVFTDEELEEIYSYVSYNLRRFVNERGSSLANWFSEYMFVAMVNVCKEWDSDKDAFLEYIHRKLVGSDDGSQKVYNYITEVIDHLSRGQNGIIYLDCYKKKYYATTIAHAFSPKQSMDSFFELCWQIYCNDMDQSYSQDDPIFALLTSQLQNKFSGNNDDDKDVQFGSEVYSFRAGIKGVAIKYPDLMKALLQDTVGLIHRLFNGESIEHNKYLNLLAEKWWKDKEETFGIQRARKSANKEKIVSDYSSITCRYIRGDRVFLSISAFRLSSDMDKHPKLNIYCGSDLVYSCQMDTKGSGLIMSAKSSQISLDELVYNTGSLDIRVSIEHAGKVIFDSKKSLYRSFILFKNDREILAQDCQPGNYSIYSLSLDQFGQYPKEIYSLGNHIYSLYAEDGEILQTEKQTIFFSSEKKQHDIWLKADKCADVLFVQGQDEYSVVEGDLFVQIQDGKNPREYGVRCDGTVFNLADFESDNKGNYVSYPITSIVDTGEPHKINVFRYQDGKILALLNVVKFNQIEILYDKPVYYDSNAKGNVEFKTDTFYRSVDFSIDDEIMIGLKEGTLFLHPPIISWRIDGGDWNCRFPERPIWYESLTNSSIIELKLPSNIEGSLFLSNCRSVVERGKKGNEFKIGQTVHSLIGNCEEVTVFYRIDKIGNDSNKALVIPIATYCLKEKMLSLPLILSKQRVFWNPENVFVGNDKSDFEVTISNNKNYVKTFNFDISTKFVNSSIIEDDYYQITIDLIKRGFVKTKEKIWSGTVCVGDERELKFKNKYLYVSRVMLSQSNKETLIHPFYIDQLHFMGEQDGSVFYSGNVYIVDHFKRKVYLNTMKNDYGEYEYINPVRLEMRTDKSFWMVWGLNKDDLNDFQAEFSLSSDNKICNSDKNVNYIDFYYINKVGEE